MTKDTPVQFNTNEEAEHLGRMARLRGETIQSNPWPISTLGRAAWRSGWLCEAFDLGEYRRLSA